MALIDNLIEEGWLKTPRIIEAFRKIKRVDFLPEEIKDLAELNEALPIGYGQTISQPLVVAFMIEKLDPQPGEKILDIGSGSGWTTALLAHIVSQEGNPKSQIPNSKQIPNPTTAHFQWAGSPRPSSKRAVAKAQNLKGKVIAIEIIPELMEFGKKNVAKYNFVEEGRVLFICSDGSKGYSKEAPFDKILVSAAAERIFPAWKEQLKIGGRIVTPIGSSIFLLIKKSEIDFQETEYPGFVFVPLITK